MKAMRLASRRGISPVIATVILVAVTIAVAIAVAFWMTGIAGLFTGAVEKLEIISLYAQRQQGGGWQVFITVKNTGTTPTSIDTIFVNGVPIDLNAPQPRCPLPVNPGLAIGLDPGVQQDITINIPPGVQCGATNFDHGVSIEIKLHTSGGKEYPKLITLP